MVKIEYLRYFKAAAEKGSFSAAASSLYVSSTSVVHGINSLEDHFGVNLFVRRKAVGVSLTPNGRELLTKVNSLMIEIDDINETFLSKKQKLSGSLVVGCQEGLAWSLAPRVAAELSKIHPNLNIVIQTTWMDSGFSTLEDGSVDLLITFLYKQKVLPNYHSELLCKPSPIAMMRKGHPVDNGEQVYLKDIARYPQVMINDGPAFELFYGIFEHVDLHPEVQMMSNISTVAQAVVGNSDAISLRILKPAHELTPLGDHVVFRQVADDVVKPDLVAITHRARSSANMLKQEAFIEQSKKLFASGEMRKNIHY